MDANQADFTLTWRRLADAALGRRAPFQDLFIDRGAASDWLDRLLARQAEDGRPATEVATSMNRVNPLYVLRNHLAEEAIRAAKAGDASEIDTLMMLLRDPSRRETATKVCRPAAGLGQRHRSQLFVLMFVLRVFGDKTAF